VRRLAVVSLVLVAISATACDRLYENRHPVCDVRPPTILMAESVKTASMIPCVRGLPAGWAFQSFDASDGEATFSLDTAAGGDSAVAVTLRRSCSPSGASASSTAPGTRLSKAVRSMAPYSATWWYEFRGGCAVVAIAFDAGAPVSALLREVRDRVSFLPRTQIARTLQREQGSRLGPASA